MITYTVYYKTTGLFSLWKKLKNVKGDGIVENGMCRFFILEDETRVEIPVHGMFFKFSKERFFSIQQRMSEEAGQDIKLKKR
jgi:hypothetical protein